MSGLQTSFDRNTCILMNDQRVPVGSRVMCSRSVLRAIGTPVEFPTVDALREFDGGIISHLTGVGGEEWAEWSWRVSLESTRRTSPMWGWLSTLPDAAEFRDLQMLAERNCRLHHAHLVNAYHTSRQQIEKEAAAVYAALEKVTVTPPPHEFYWAVLIMLSRGRMFLRSWSDTVSEEEVAAEIGVMPFMDLVNGPDGGNRRPNAHIEVAFSSKEVPDWYSNWLKDEHHTAGEEYLRDLFPAHYCSCLTLTRPLLPAEEIVLDYDLPLISTGSTTEADSVFLTRFLKYLY